MKKLLLLLAVCTITVSCKWYHETFNSPEECAEWYAEEMHDAIVDDDVDKFLDVYNDYTKWFTTLGEVDRIKVNKWWNDWREDNEKKAEDIDKQVRDIYEKYTE
jgi:hypothetical protein